MTDGTRPDYPALLRRSLLAIEELERRLAVAERGAGGPVAIVGIGCRFPGGADDLESFWQLLREGRDAVTEVPADRWDMDAFFDPDPDAIGKSYSRWGGFLRDVQGFDASFFGISPREARGLDPQHRLLLEVTWEALEHAGISPGSLAGSEAAVFVGITTTDYSTRRIEAIGPYVSDFYSSSGTADSMASGRISYVLGLQGPNMAIDTACSSTLAAVHLGLRALRGRETDVALVGGVNLILSPVGAVLTSRGRMMSFDGRCKAFDASADGYVRSEGCGMLVLRRLADAERDGDRILAVIRGSAVNHDGRAAGLTVPHGPAQVAVIRAALADAGVSPEEIGLIEAHGTGTSLGDPIEVKALDQIFGSRPADRPLLLGSVKTNIGHTEAAAGVAGLIKAVLALRHRTVPPHLHLRTPSPHIPWDRLRIAVPTSLTAWPSPGGLPRRAGVSSFGFSGTNAHVVLEEAPAPHQVAAVEGPQLLVLSAQAPAALDELLHRYAARLAAPEAPPLASVAATAAFGRSHLAERLAFVADDVAGAAAVLSGLAAGERPPGVARGRTAGAPPEIAFLFTGQGSQYPGMSLQLFECRPAFREALRQCDEILRPLLGRSLVEVLHAEGEVAGLLDDTAWTQPALFAVEYALSRLWASWGVEPALVMGHSVGEYVAACIAGVFNLEDGLTLIAARGRLMSTLPRDGSMVAVFADEATVSAAVGDRWDAVSIAATNGPGSTVVSGRSEVVQQVVAELTSAGVESQRLNVSHAFHSPLMAPMLDAFEAEASRVRYAPPRIALVSNVTGRLAGDEIASPAYWRRHVMAPVRFMESIATLQEEGVRLHVEVGPTSVLLKMAQRCPVADDSVWVPSLHKGVDEQVAMLQGAAELHVRGVPLRWSGIMGEDARRRRADLPTYPFQRQRFWQDFASPARRAEVGSTGTGHPLLGEALESPLHVFQGGLGVSAQPWLADHRIAGITLFPAAGFVELAHATARRVIGPRVEVRQLTIHEGLPLPEETLVTTQVIATPRGGGEFRIEIYAHGGDGPWRLHASAEAAPDSTPPAVPEDLSALSASGSVVDPDAYYEALRERGADYGPSFRGIRHAVHSGPEVLGRVQLPDTAQLGAPSFGLHPALLDACIQLIGFGMPADGSRDGDGEPWVPVGLERCRVFVDGVAAAQCRARVSSVVGTASELRSDLLLFGDDGRAIAEVVGLRLRRVSRAALRRAMGVASAARWLHDVRWVEKPAQPPEGSALEGQWLVCADEQGVGREVATLLEAAGARVTLAWRGDGLMPCDEGWRVDALDPEQVRGMVALAGGPGFAGVVCLWPLDAAGGASSLERLEGAHRELLGGVLHLAQAIADAGAPLWLVTRGAQAVSGNVPDVAQAPVWGLGGVIAAEYPALRAARIDLDPVAAAAGAEAVVAELRRPDAEDRIAWRTGRRYVARLTPVPVAPDPATAPRRLEIAERGSLDHLALVPMVREVPGPGQVEIRVLATGLNFRDVLNALGMYPGDPGPLGNECAGIVTAVGDGVADLQVGDEVVAMADRSFATHVVASADLTVRKPSNLTFADAATIPVTFLTADYALRDLAHLRAGECVLVHAVTGGVGMAALQLARRMGARVIGTAGSDEKRALALSLGASHVADSRSLSFVDNVREATAGAGVDVVLNSLAGDFIPASLGLLSAGGRFVEIGRTGVWEADRVAREYPGVGYAVLYLGDVAATRPQFLRERLQALLADFEAGVLTPLPHRDWPLEEAEGAFRFMGQGRHVGKLVVTQREAPVVRPDAAYLITGGLGGLGLAFADWLAQRGARHLVLVGRRTPSDDAGRHIARLREAGVNVVVARTDASDRGELAALLAHCGTSLPPLRGIVHSAGVLDDATLANQDLARLERVLAPKVRGTWLLDELTTELPLDFILLFSSLAALSGPPGQGNYAAANAFMDAFAHAARGRGRPVCSVNWGPWAEVGMAAALDEQYRNRVKESGLELIEPGDGPRMLWDAMRSSDGPQVAVIPLLSSRLPVDAAPFFDGVRESSTVPVTAAAAVPWSTRLSGASGEARRVVMVDFLREQVSQVFALGSPGAVDENRSLLDVGMDSLMAMELRNRIASTVHVRLDVTDLLQGPTTGQLVDRVLRALGDTAPAQREEMEL